MEDREQYPGEQWIPSNGTEGYSFLEAACGNCQRDKSMREGVPIDECDDSERCDIIAASFRGEAKEWRLLDDGTLKCVKFVHKDDPIPEPRCEHTADLFAAEIGKQGNRAKSQEKV